MDILNTRPDTYDYLRPNGFKMEIKGLPNVTYAVQSTSLPGLSLGNAEQATPFVNIPHPGDKLQFEPITLSFIVSEGLENYLELYNWMAGLGFPTSHQDYRNFMNRRAATEHSGDQNVARNLLERTDIALFILTSANNPSKYISFRDAFPISLQGIDFDLKTSESEPLLCSVTFLYTTFQVVNV